jgi:hypothetical protein
MITFAEAIAVCDKMYQVSPEATAESVLEQLIADVHSKDPYRCIDAAQVLFALDIEEDTLCPTQR